MPIAGYYTTAEAADLLGLSQPAVQDAVRRGALKADKEKIARRTLIPAAEVKRYAREVQGAQGWDKRKQPAYTPNTKQRTYQQAYYQCRKATRKQSATEPAEKD
jgi:excisionase family DNA binding protein